MILENANSKNAIWIKQKIGELMHHMVISTYLSPREKSMTIMELNALDRESIALDWFNSTVSWNHYQEERVWNVIEDFYDCSSGWFIKDLAIYIDKRLVQAYIKARDNIDVSPSQVIVTLDKDGNLPYGLKYKYSENYTSLLPASVAPATKKQLDYLKDLAIKNGYYFNNEGLTKEKASSYINFFKNMNYIAEPDDFNLYFIKAI